MGKSKCLADPLTNQDIANKQSITTSNSREGNNTLEFILVQPKAISSSLKSIT